MQKAIRNGPITGRLSPANHGPIRNLLLCTSIKEAALMSLPYRRNTGVSDYEYELRTMSSYDRQTKDGSEAAPKAADLVLPVAEAEEAVDMVSRLSKTTVWPTLSDKSWNRWLRPLLSRRQPRRHGQRLRHERPTTNRWRPYASDNGNMTSSSYYPENLGISGRTGRS